MSREGDKNEQNVPTYSRGETVHGTLGQLSEFCTPAILYHPLNDLI